MAVSRRAATKLSSLLFRPTRQVHDFANQLSYSGICCEIGQPKKGVAHGPQSLRDFGVIDRLESTRYTVLDRGDKLKEITGPTESELVGRVKNPTTVGKICEEVSNLIAEDKNSIHLTVGGDHSVAAGSVHGHASIRDNVGLIWVDAHADINTTETTPSGNMHGMPLSLLLRELADCSAPLPGFEWCSRRLTAKDLVYIGLRDIDHGELEIIHQLNILHYTMEDIQKMGIQTVMSQVITYLAPGPGRPLHLSFDIDSLDPNVAPSTGTSVPGGLSHEDGLHICRTVGQTGVLGGMDLVEVNPSLGTSSDVKQTVSAAVDMIMAAFGKEHAH